MSLAATTLNAQADATGGHGAAARLAPGVEDDGADCPVPNPGGLTADSKLPDPFTRIDGTRVTAVSDWRCRRAEIRSWPSDTSTARSTPSPPRSRGRSPPPTSPCASPTRAEAPASRRRSNYPMAPGRSRPSWSSADSERTRPPSRQPEPPSSATTPRGRSGGHGA
ncbi:hypothetical protein NKH77_55370 [Streptomyces sp. M19]